VRSARRIFVLVDQLDLDSMDHQNLLAALGSEHAVAIPESDVAILGRSTTS
jgi:acyl carrier protein